MGVSLMSEMLLEIRGVSKFYGQRSPSGKKQDVAALQDFNLSIAHSPATVSTIAGESGSGKTTLANLALGFTNPSSGQILYEGQDMATANAALKKEYMRNVQAVFQDPFGVFNPFYRVKHVFDLVINNFKLASSKQAAQDLIEESLNVVGLYGEDVLRKYPHQLSGGQRQRIMMARAYMVKPKIIVADEPVSMVDASLRASILDLMMRLRDSGISFIYITHDLSTAYQIGDHIYILYQGTIAESGNTVGVINQPQHPYVQLLIHSVPAPDPNITWQGTVELPVEEEMRSSTKLACRFYPRCPARMSECLEHSPPLYKINDIDHLASCFLHKDKGASQRRKL